MLFSHRSLLLNGWYIGECQRLGPEDRVCVPVPFYHCFGTVIGTLCCMVRECTMFVAELEHETFAGRDLSSLRTGVMAGSPCPIEIMNRVVGDMGAHEMTIAYGLTEASPVITETLADDPVEIRVSTVGRPLPGVEVRVLDPVSGRVLPDGESGELQARGHNVMLGYFRMPEATAEAIVEGGWLRTGDLAVREANGYYRITGRIKDMIICGGENIYPRGIEEFLYTHPSVESAQAVGVPDPKFGEEVCVWIRLRRGATVTADEIRSFCKSRLAYFKVPRYVKFVDEFPLTVTGKVQKFRIREQAIEEYGLGPGHGDVAFDDKTEGDAASSPGARDEQA